MVLVVERGPLVIRWKIPQSLVLLRNDKFLLYGKVKTKYDESHTRRRKSK